MKKQFKRKQKTLSKKIEDMKENYGVGDLNIEKAKIIFVGESPHTNEVEIGVPLAGSSGITITRFISKLLELSSEEINATPFGLLVKQNWKFSHFGIMNVSNFPLQKKLYDKQMIENNSEIFAAIKTIRSNPDSITRREKVTEDFEKYLINDFKKRLSKCTNAEIIIPLGKFARAFLKKIYNANPNLSNIYFDKDIKHPSTYNSKFWNVENKNKALQELSKIILTIIENSKTKS